LCKRTVDGNGNALAQDVAIGALKGWDLAELVEKAVVVRDTLGWLGVDDVEVELVCLGDSEEGSGARVVLQLTVSLCGGVGRKLTPGSAVIQPSRQDSRGKCRACRKEPWSRLFLASSRLCEKR